MALIDILLSRCAEALDKQEPKEPKLEDGFYICPICGADESYLIYETDLYRRFNYCGKCGQRLKWEGDDDGRK